MHRILLSLGSNLNPQQNLQSCLTYLEKKRKSPSLYHRKLSRTYHSKPRDFEDQPDFLNAVVSFETDASPQEVQTMLQEIEQKLGKNPPFRFGPRTIDIDILLYDDLILPSREEWLKSGEQRAGSGELLIPHPRMHQRRFVLEPLCELIDPEKLHPVLRKSWRELLEKTENQQCEVTESFL